MKKKKTYRLWEDWQSGGETGLKCAAHRAVWGLRHFWFCFWFVFKVDFYQHAMRTLHLNVMGWTKGLAPELLVLQRGAVYFFLCIIFF